MSQELPNAKYITIHDNQSKIELFLLEMLIKPHLAALNWSNITNQTPNLKIGYPSQHLASLIVGMKGTATGARGNDIVDASEVKSCCRLDQSDKCKNCNKSVLRNDSECPYCGSKYIKRNNDSKWLIPIRSDLELKMALEETPRFIFMLYDYPMFEEGNFNEARIVMYEIWPKSKRSYNFRTLLNNYYEYLYKPHIIKNPSRTPAPKNFWPESFQFYMCNPVKIFECHIHNWQSNMTSVEITHLIGPSEDRSKLKSEDLPIELLNGEERDILRAKGISLHSLKAVDEDLKKLLDLRDTDKKPKDIGVKQSKEEF